MQVKFNNNTLNNYFYITNIQGLGIPNTKDHELSLANNNGSFYENTNIDSRIITISCAMISDVTKSVYEKLDEINTIVNPYIGEKKLEIGCYPNRYINARLSGGVTIDQLTTLMNFPLQFKCSNPFFYSNDLTTTNIVAAGTNITNSGSFASNNYTIEFTLPNGVTATIKNTTNNKQIVLENNTVSSYNVLFDVFNHGTITTPDKLTNLPFYKSGEPFVLEPGVNNITLTGIANAVIKYRSCWL